MKVEMPVWVLSLKADQARREYMHHHLTQLGLDFEWVDGIDGRQLDLNRVEEYSEAAALKEMGRPLSPGQVGCTLAHYRMWQRVVTENHQQVLIFEDDVAIRPELLEVIAAVSQFPKDWEFINFSTDAEQIPFGPEVSAGFRISNHVQFAYRNSAYMISYQGAQKLLASALPLRMICDDLTAKTHITGLVSYGCTPKLVSTGIFPSSIWRGEAPYWKSYKKTGWFIRVMDRLKGHLRAVLPSSIYFGMVKRWHRLRHQVRNVR